MLSSVEIEKSDTRIPEIIRFYNSTKFGVDVTDQMAKKYSVKSLYQRWLLQIFFNILDLAEINAWILYKETTSEEVSRQERQLSKECSSETITNTAIDSSGRKACQIRYCLAIMPPSTLQKYSALQKTHLQGIRGIKNRLHQRSLTKEMVEERIKDLKAFKDQARKAHQEFIAGEDKLDTDVVNIVLDQIQSAHEEARDECLKLLSQLENSKASTSKVMSSNTTYPSLKSNAEKPTFSGKYEEWDQFCNSFMFHVNKYPDDKYKLTYLETCLCDRAAKWFKDEMTTGADFKSIWEALKTRYYNPRFILRKKVKKLWNLGTRLENMSMNQILEVIKKMQKILQTLKNNGWPLENWDSMLIAILHEHLPTETRIVWERELKLKEKSFKQGSSSLPCFMPTFAEMVAFLENIAQTPLNKRGEKRSTPNALPYNLQKITGLPDEEQSGSSSYSRCPLCTGQHSLVICNDFLTKSAIERHKDIIRLQRCFICLDRHYRHACSSSRSCEICKGNHHTLIHLKDTRE
ncbi:PREDICTED: uncharacterized protein LOC107067896 [Polistes dominula]|uniref:Uncharacterized protein LOC107067896 n=1 Tax=Polistes dominula TaxID=743375 RepID=A0ABM1IGG8_POLDO|nr:PREDICTED: uncharacterized protein LOC107067896 [Polistes dominula]